MTKYVPLAVRTLLSVLLAMGGLSGAPVWGATTGMEGCSAGSVLAVVAHTDDDLLFMNPDQQTAITQGQCVRTVYLTAGDRGEGLPYLQQRERGIMAAYAAMAKVPDIWTTDALHVDGRSLVRHTLHDNPRVQLIMLRIPDPWLGPGWGSLTPLSRLESVPGTHVQSYGPYRETYTRTQLVSLLASLIQAEQPQVVRTMDPTITVAYQALCWKCKGHDHPDHIASAHLMDDAMAIAPGLYTQIAYLDYPSQERPTNLSPAQTRRKTAIFLRYMRDDHHYCPDPSQCAEVRGPEAKWVSRQYTVNSSRATATAER
ncbi:MAG TPA: PIG-L family deacetylase [Castellaniella sp.]|uniref:PIG-L family deacetylase n=1 Tax=Castellaniella sp. TaxID=1955812 RepID=UPI002EF9C6E2